MRLYFSKLEICKSELEISQLELAAPNLAIDQLIHQLLVFILQRELFIFSLTHVYIFLTLKNKLALHSVFDWNRGTWTGHCCIVSTCLLSSPSKEVILFP